MQKTCLKLLLGALASTFCGPLVAAVVLQYHHVSDTSPPSTSISPALFEQHLDVIESKGYEVWPLPKLVQHVQARKTLPRKVVALTFDDAFSSVYEHAYPLLAARKLPFTVFVATQAIQDKPDAYMSWSQLKEVSENGATIANHTQTHAHLVRRLDGETHGLWLERVRVELEGAQALIEQHTAERAKLIAYPYGEYTSEIQDLIREMGYTGFGQQSGAIGPDSDFSALPRFPMTNRFGSMKHFPTKLASLPMPIMAITPKLKIVRGAELENGLTIEFQERYSWVNCFFEGKALDTELNAQSVIIRSMPALPVGRSRINCTAPSKEKGRYHWFSHDWMRTKADGSWYKD